MIRFSRIMSPIMGSAASRAMSHVTRHSADTVAYSYRMSISDGLSKLGECLDKGAIIQDSDLTHTPFEGRASWSLHQAERNELQAFYCRRAIKINPCNKHAIANLADCIENGAAIQREDLLGTLFQLKITLPTLLKDKYELIHALRMKAHGLPDIESVEERVETDLPLERSRRGHKS